MGMKKRNMISLWVGETLITDSTLLRPCLPRIFGTSDLLSVIVNFKCGMLEFSFWHSENIFSWCFHSEQRALPRSWRSCLGLNNFFQHTTLSFSLMQLLFQYKTSLLMDDGRRLRGLMCIFLLNVNNWRTKKNLWKWQWKDTNASGAMSRRFYICWGTLRRQASHPQEHKTLGGIGPDTAWTWEFFLSSH